MILHVKIHEEKNALWCLESGERQDSCRPRLKYSVTTTKRAVSAAFSSSFLWLFSKSFFKKSQQNKHSCYFLLFVVIFDTNVVYTELPPPHLGTRFMCFCVVPLLFYVWFLLPGNVQYIHHHRKPCAFKGTCLILCELTAIPVSLFKWSFITVKTRFHFKTNL